jgi:hypothetical protein
MACVERGDAETAKPVDERVPRIVAVDGAEVRLDGGGAFELILVMRLVEDAGEADDGMGVDKARGDDVGVDSVVAVRDSEGTGGAHGFDAAVLDEDDSVEDRVAGHGVDGVTADGELGGGWRYQEQERGEAVEATEL